MSDCNELCRGLRGLVRVEEPAAAMGIRVAWGLAWGKSVRELDGSVLKGEVERLLEELRGRYKLEGLRMDPVVRAYRDFYWSIGVDPTKTRPSAEALVRRALRSRWPRVNPVVDAGNIASARTMVPIGVYDAEQAALPARITLSRGGEIFHPIGGGEAVLKEGLPVMVDSSGRVMHLYPHRDSVETMVRPETRCVLVLAAGLVNVPWERTLEAVEETLRLLELLGWERCPGLGCSGRGAKC